ncbi:F-box/WD repeat protein Pop1 [Schizosaccharomyces cryophilus OY26]|uniref:F-box/WD repeat protein Pop1 n=1 Tax=Schizosaccharomyces cryophilus (strain OY26 / ATCC MYA-4695 / CBS 11777 / NBRC 106824 / NRRL Y48691) TaxID=653667 RepID=S9W5B3_SCHCR|nr:F-box/WD repeat protein Pop1 [Schizosaccharomyces cryophilus OY26]EPY53749.1 F-box/WD repeat protein Pop1 [Schizosaccharomyces cryophilus OY26]
MSYLRECILGEKHILCDKIVTGIDNYLLIFMEIWNSKSYSSAEFDDLAIQVSNPSTAKTITRTPSVESMNIPSFDTENAEVQDLGGNSSDDFEDSLTAPIQICVASSEKVWTFTENPELSDDENLRVLENVLRDSGTTDVNRIHSPYPKPVKRPAGFPTINAVHKKRAIPSFSLDSNPSHQNLYNKAEFSKEAFASPMYISQQSSNTFTISDEENQTESISSSLQPLSAEGTSMFSHSFPSEPNTSSNKSLGKRNEELDAVLQLDNIISTFETLPQSVQHYLLSHLLKKSSKHALQKISEFLIPVFKKDLLSNFPPEISRIVLSYLDAPSLCAVSKVCRGWSRMVSHSDEFWKNLFIREGFYWDSYDDQVKTLCLKRSLSNCNTMKKIYLRHYQLRKRWMNAPKRIKHYSFPVHGVDLITKVQFDDEKIVVSTCSPKINVYSTKTGALIRSLEEHEGQVWAFEYIGDTLVTGSTDRTVRVWDLRTGECKQVFHGHRSTIRCIKIVCRNNLNTDIMAEKENNINSASLMPPYIVSSSRDCTIRLWRLPDLNDPPFMNQRANNEENENSPTPTNPYHLRTLRGHTDSIREVACEGDTIVSASYDGTVRVWRASTGACLHVLRGHVGRVYSVAIDSSGKRCMSAGLDAKIRIWDTETGELIQVLNGHSSLVSQVTLKNDFLVSASASPDNSLRVWDTKSGKCLCFLKCPIGHIFFQHDESKIISGSKNKLQLWDIRSGKLVRDLLTELDSIWQVGYNENICVAAVLRDNRFWIDVLDFGSSASSS